MSDELPGILRRLENIEKRLEQAEKAASENTTHSKKRLRLAKAAEAYVAEIRSDFADVVSDFRDAIVPLEWPKSPPPAHRPRAISPPELTREILCLHEEHGWDARAIFTHFKNAGPLPELDTTKQGQPVKVPLTRYYVGRELAEHVANKSAEVAEKSSSAEGGA